MSWDPRIVEPQDPDPFKALRTLNERFGKGAGKKLALAAVLVAGVIGLISSYTQVEPDEVGIVLRLGRFVTTLDPGPHFVLPYGLERVRKVPVQRQLKMEFGFRTAGSRNAGQSSYRDDPDVQREAIMLTGDLNVAVVEWIVQYKIKDPYKFLFKVKNVEQTLAVMAEAAMRIVVGDHSVNEVLTTGRQSVASDSKLLLQDLADRYETGVDIQQVVLQDVNPPDAVKASFNEVNQAIQEKERAINEAHAELNRAIPRAKGEAEETLRQAEGYAIERLNRANGEADRFQKIYAEYKKAPEVTRRRMYLETVPEVLKRAGHKMVIDDVAKGITPLLRLESSDEAAAAAAKGGAQ